MVVLYSVYVNDCYYRPSHPNQRMEINAAEFIIESHRLIEESISSSVTAKERPVFISVSKWLIRLFHCFSINSLGRFSISSLAIGLDLKAFNFFSCPRINFLYDSIDFCCCAVSFERQVQYYHSASQNLLENKVCMSRKNSRNCCR